MRHGADRARPHVVGLVSESGQQQPGGANASRFAPRACGGVRGLVEKGALVRGSGWNTSESLCLEFGTWSQTDRGNYDS